jgi:hypothetical protein
MMADTEDVPADFDDAPTAYYAALHRLAERYFSVWPAERKALLEEHKRDARALSKEIGTSLQSVADDLGSSLYADRLIEPARRLATTGGQLVDEGLFARIWRWLIAEKSRGGVLGMNLVFNEVPIFTPQEVPTFKGNDEALRNRPPVTIGRTRSDGLLATSFTYPGHVIGREAMPAGNVRDRFDDLAAAFGDAVQLPPGARYDDRTLRDRYVAFAKAFQSWATSGAFEPAAQKQNHAPGQFAPETALVVPSAPPVLRGFIPSILRPYEWIIPIDDSPFWRNESNDKLSFLAYFGDVKPGGAGVTAARAAELQTIFKSVVDPKTVVLFGACMSLWIKAQQSGKLDAGNAGPVRLHVNSLLELFDYKKERNGGYNTRQKRELSDRLKHLDQARADFRYRDDRNVLRHITGRYVDVAPADEEDLFGNRYPYEFLVQPGAAMAAFVVNAPKLMSIYSALAPLFAGRRTEQIAAQIGVYLCGLFRIRETHPDQYARPILVKTLLDNSHVPIEADSGNYGRFRDRVEDALTLLVGKVYSGWEYRPEDVARVEKGYGSFRAWIGDGRKANPGSAIIFSPLPDVFERSAIRRDALQGHIRIAKRRKGRRSAP